MANLGMSTLTSAAMVLVAGLLVVMVSAMGPAVSPTSEQPCDSTFVLPCLPFLAPGQPSMKPSPMCCNPVNAALKNETQRACLCSLLKDTELLKSSGVDPAKAATLPEMCNPAYKGVDICLSPSPSSPPSQSAPPSPSLSPPTPPSATPPPATSSPPPVKTPSSSSPSSPPKSETPKKSSGFALSSTFSAGASGLLMIAMFAAL